jgi:hypothetical protein
MNNYDTSSSGENIEINVQYDNDLSGHYFDNFEKENTRLKLGLGHSAWLIGDVNKSYYTKTQLNKMTKAQLIELDDMYQILCPYDYNDTTKKELIDELKNVTIKHHYEWMADYYTYYDFIDNIKHDYHKSIGYSQGDVVYAINVDEEMSKEYKKYIDHIFWDTPIYISIDVNTEEFREFDLVDDEYNYDKNEVIEAVKKLNISDYAKEWIAENLPSEPAYDWR